MIAIQTIRRTLEELSGITRAEFALYDPYGSVLFSTEKAMVSEPGIIVPFMRSEADSQIIGECYLLKIREDEEAGYCLSANGRGDETWTICRVAKHELENLSQLYKDKYNRSSFFQNLLLDNLLLVDIYNQSKRLHISYQMPRAIILFEFEASIQPQDNAADELLQELFRAQNGDYLTAIDENSVILVKSLQNTDQVDKLEEAAGMAVDTIESELMINVRASYGGIVNELKDLSSSYKEARMAMDVGKIFYAEKRIISYARLGIGRLIYQLPPSLCTVFIREVFGEKIPDHLDNEMMTTINTFFDNNLNVSETARQLFVHRNTLVYRFERLEKEFGLDLRNFNDALVFYIAMMVVRYMKATNNL